MTGDEEGDERGSAAVGILSSAGMGQCGQTGRSSIRASCSSWDSAAGVMGSRMRRGARFWRTGCQKCSEFHGTPALPSPQVPNPTAVHPTSTQQGALQPQHPWPAVSLLATKYMDVLGKWRVHAHFGPRMGYTALQLALDVWPLAVASRMASCAPTRGGISHTLTTRPARD